MGIKDLVNRTKTYIAGDWTGDSDLINKLEEWNKSENLDLSFVNVHEVTQSSDSSLKCSIKRSLRQRISISKTFVLIVGKSTKGLRSGACYNCESYVSSVYGPFCSKKHTIDNRSFVDFECEMALKDYNDGKLKNIVVIYNGLTSPDYSRCPQKLRNVGLHIGSDILENGDYKWAYTRIKNAICR